MRWVDKFNVYIIIIIGGYNDRTTNRNGKI